MPEERLIERPLVYTRCIGPGHALPRSAPPRGFAHRLLRVEVKIWIVHLVPEIIEHRLFSGGSLICHLIPRVELVPAYRVHRLSVGQRNLVVELS